MPDSSFRLNENTLPIIEEIGRHMPGGFFIYKAHGNEELLYANRAVLEIFGCRSLEEFKALTGFTFKGMLYPEDYRAISESIDHQIAVSDDNMDYVEYRIVRKDGQVRWVDDYGHYTETEAYGGIYYVFISDITEKRERRETDMATRQAVIEALSESYHTVWLISDVEQEAFSLYRGDTEGATEHAAPISKALGSLKYSQAKEYYINTTVAPEDRERLGRELAIEAIADRLRQKPQYSVNYLRLMADGSRRYFRIEFARVNMPGGKMGVVCGFKDVDDDVREGQATQQALREAKTAEARATQQRLEEQLALQERLLEQERENLQQAKMITALASDYRCVYYVALDTDEGICYRTDHVFEEALNVGDHFDFQSVFTAYCERFVAEPYREGFMEFIDPSTIRQRLEKQLIITYRYLIKRNGVESYEMLRMAGVRRPEDRGDHIVHAIGVGFTDIDQEMRETLARNEALRDALSVAEEANRAKTAFLSNMSHEIRTPMNAIIGLDNIALSDNEISDRTREYLEKIGASAQHLLSIINDILDMSRIESGRMVIRSEEFSLSRTLEQVNTIIAGQCRDKGLSYNCRVIGAPEDYYIGDDMKLRQVLINILGNAVKFTPEGGSVGCTIEEVARFEDNATLRFSLSDTGIGMSAEFLPKIFDSFSQEDSSSTSKYGSTGLGLAITKNLVDLMNGKIEVESEKGAGTTFTVTVTLEVSPRKDEEDGADAVHAHEMSVLVIDDDPIALEHALLVLGHAGIACDTALSGEEALRMVELRQARREAYNLILVDWKMPDMDGIETTRRIRRIVGRDSAIVILTSYNWDDIEEEARFAGVDSFVPKPLFAGTVMDEFKSARKKRRAAQPRRAVPLEGRRVLLAEDVAINAEIMLMILEMRQIQVDWAENGRLAVEKFAASPEKYYDAILMDMRMPEMDGLEATTAIRAMDRDDSKTVPIIALTANAFDEDVQRSLQAGLNAHLSKPVEPDALFETLQGLIN